MSAEKRFSVQLSKFWQKDWQVVAVVCNQWGDTGKGKIVDLLMGEADVCVRGQGGANAGHTLVVGDKKLILHLVPSGIMHDSAGKICLIGRGVAFDPGIFLSEIEEVQKAELTTANLKISHEAPLMLPYHLFRDRISAASRGIGTTGRGIGPLYSDFTARRSLFVNDLLNPEVFCQKMAKFAKEEAAFLAGVDRQAAKEVLEHEHLQSGYYFHPEKVIDVDRVVEMYLEIYAPQLAQYVIEAGKLIQALLANKKRIVLEGAQGCLLSVLHGTTQFQTSSDCSIDGLAQGCHLSTKQVDHVIGIVKAPVMTRVGSGPFPTEIGGQDSESYCGSGRKRDDEQLRMPEPRKFLNSVSEFEQAMAVRLVSDEYGATTGRTRRVGWLDLVALKYSVGINGKRIALTKFDVLRGVKKIRVGVSYTYLGEDYRWGDRLIKHGDTIKDFGRFSEFLYKCRPNYVDFAGWEEDISAVTEFEGLPEQVKKLVRFIEAETGCQVEILSVGPDREQTIFI